MSVREQTAQHFKDRLEQFCYEFYEFLNIDEEMTIEDVASAVVDGLNDFHTSINGKEIEKQLSESNNELGPMADDDEGD